MDSGTSEFSFGTASVSGNVEPVTAEQTNEDKKSNVIYINIRTIMIIGIVAVAILIIVLLLWLLFRKNSYSNRRRRNILKRNRRYNSEFDDFDF